MLEPVDCLKVVSWRQQAKAACPNVKYCQYILGERGARLYGSMQDKKIHVPCKTYNISEVNHAFTTDVRTKKEKANLRVSVSYTYNNMSIK